MRNGHAMRRPALRLALPVLLGLLLSCGALGVAVWRSAPGAARAEAARKWEARGFDGYRLVIRERSAGGSCEQEMEVRGERVVRMLRSTCARSTRWTITLLFQRLAQAQDRSARCAGAGLGYDCPCLSYTEVQASYDPQLGYPRLVGTNPSWRENWAHADYWRFLWRNNARPECAGGGDDFMRLVYVTSLTPTP